MTKRLREVWRAQVAGPRCEHEIIDPASAEWRRSHGRDLRCARHSRYEIDGRMYCGQHAGVLAIQILLQEK